MTFFSKKVISTGHFGKEGNFTIHPLISVNGDKASSNWLIYLMWAHKSTGQSLFWEQGVYDCQYKKIDGEWKISLLKLKSWLHPPGWPEGLPEECILEFERLRNDKSDRGY